MKNTVEDYLNLPYRIEMVRNEDGSFFVSIRELPGCMSEGDTIEEAYTMIKDAQRCWIETALENGQDIPLPEELTDKKYSGKFILRIPKELHKKLTINAEKNNVSLNAYINTLLAEKNTMVNALNQLVNNLLMREHLRVIKKRKYAVTIEMPLKKYINRGKNLRIISSKENEITIKETV